MVKIFIISILVIFIGDLGYCQVSDSVDVCGHTIRFNSTCVVNQSFQSVKCDEFEMMWLYLITNPSIQEKSISKNEFGEVNYISSYSLDNIAKKGFSIYPKKKEEVIHTGIALEVLGVKLNGYKIELKGKKKSIFYLVITGEINNKKVGFQVKLNKDVTSNNDLPMELKKVIKLL